ncbi:MAG: cytidine deaminase [Spirochaetaceae bacterium]|nr:cytidine deaminase [Spirochaetaceae bacterium]|tara:strand:+ start:362066 stop:362440 length:375 start_codon:yes stop_codon:yes gene_type:complete
MDSLIQTAQNLAGEFALARPSFTAGAVGAALKSASGKVYTGICVELACGIGFCAEHAAMAEMLKMRETVIDTIVACKVDEIVAPCGRCREMMYQVDARNRSAKIILTENRIVTLDELLPEHWKI